MFVGTRYSELDRVAKQKDTSITRLREAAQEREAQLQAEVKSLTAQLEKSAVGIRQLEWTARDLEKDKSSVVERLYNDVGDRTNSTATSRSLIAMSNIVTM